MAGKTVRVTFDCGEAGKITWDVPRDMVQNKSDREIRRLMNAAWGDSIDIFFKLIRGLSFTGGTALEHGMEEIDSNLRAIAKRALLRGQG